MRPSRTVVDALFENAPRFVDRLFAMDADSYEALIDRAQDLASELAEPDQLELLNGHPRIGAVPSSVSATSFREQGYDRDTGSAELQALLSRLNDEYERRFGFRFVVFVGGRSRQEIARLLEDRLHASRTDELARGLSDVFAIARDRLSKLQPAHQEAR